jgi:hypothetical protein
MEVRVTIGTGSEGGTSIPHNAVAADRVFSSSLSGTNLLTEADSTITISAGAGSIGFYVTSVYLRNAQGARMTAQPVYSYTPVEGDTNPGTGKAVARTIINNSQSTRFAQRINGWDIEAWTDSRAAGNTEMTVYTDGSFSGEWTSTYNTLFRTGRKFNPEPRISDADRISLRYSASEFTSNRGATYLCVYGWTRNTTVEWYIVDNWLNWNPARAQRHPSSQVQPDFTGGTSNDSTYRWHGTVEANGGTYDIISAWRINQPSIDAAGNSTFLQFFNIRRDRRMSGDIDVTAHFNSWVALGDITNPQGDQTSSFSNNSNLYEVSFTVEGYGGLPDRSSGKGTVDTLCIKAGSDILCTSGGCDNCGGTPTDNRILLGDLSEKGSLAIGDALEILKYLAKLDSAVSPNNPIAWDAARIITPGQGAPTINDALEVLKHLAKLDSKAGVWINKTWA